MFIPKHEVSTKIALYDEHAERVLVMVYPGRAAYGLPGGHLEKDELPDAAIVREVEEELGITISEYERKDFFLHKDTRGKVILAYTGRLAFATIFDEPQKSFEFGKWVTRPEFEALPKISIGYRKFILENWPTTLA